jgi:hypothetical protein
VLNDQAGQVVESEDLVICLIRKIVDLCRDSGGTLEESVAAAQAAIAILPFASIRSRNETRIPG